jgi:phosphotransferase system enzyme I (PtsI)
VLIDPDSAELDQLHARQQRRAAYEQSLQEYRALVPVTEDGLRLRLEANIESPDDTLRAREHGAEGIGLFRSEFLLAAGNEAASNEDLQYDVYRRLVESAAPGRVTVRTFDLSDAQLNAAAGPLDGARAPLGLRGVRLSLAHDDMFQVQLRALLRAAAHGPLRIMFPFVSALEELRAARAAVERAAEALRGRGISPPPVPVGVMIEVPSAALTADILADEADFFSLGTNDLIQYCLAVDRTDDRVSQLYEPLHPAILRMVRLVARAGRRRALPVSVCGEMASDPVLLTLLVGLGITEFSMAATAIPLAKQVLRGLRADEMAKVAARALRARTSADVERVLMQFLAPLEIKHE